MRCHPPSHIRNHFQKLTSSPIHANNVGVHAVAITKYGPHRIHNFGLLLSRQCDGLVQPIGVGAAEHSLEQDQDRAQAGHRAQVLPVRIDVLVILSTVKHNAQLLSASREYGGEGGNVEQHVVPIGETTRALHRTGRLKFSHFGGSS